MTPSVIFGTLKLVITSFDLGGRRSTLYSGGPWSNPGDHPCRFSAHWDNWCGRESRTYLVSDNFLDLQLYIKMYGILGFFYVPNKFPKEFYKFWLLQTFPNFGILCPNFGAEK